MKAGRLEPAADPGPSQGALLDIRELEYGYGPDVLFRQVSWSLGPGEIGVVVGPNGAGKSTLLQVVAGLRSPWSGAVRVAGQPTTADRGLWRAWVGYVGHRPLLYPELTAWENLVFFARLYGFTATEARRRAEAGLERAGLTQVARRWVGELSRGTVQRLEVVRATLHAPRLWLWDEPFTGLDAGGAAWLEDWLNQHRAQGGAAVVVLHDVQRAWRLADRWLLLARGRAQALPGGALDSGELQRWLEGQATARPRQVSAIPEPVSGRGVRPDVGSGGVPIPMPGAGASAAGLAPSPRPAGGAAEGDRVAPGWRPGRGPAAGDPAAAEHRPAQLLGLGQWAMLVRKDLTTEWRRREGLATLATFVLLVGLVFAFGFDPGRNVLAPFMAGLLWIAFYFAAVLLFVRGFPRESDQGTLDGLLLAPLDRSLLYLSKATAQGAVLALLQLLLVPVIMAWLGFRGDPAWGGFVVAMALGTLGLTAVGTLLGALTATVRGRELVLPVLLFPLTAPLVLGVVQSLAAALAGDPAQAGPWYRLLAVYDTMFLVVSALVFDLVVKR